MTPAQYLGEVAVFWPPTLDYKNSECNETCNIFGWQGVNKTSKSDLEFRNYLDVKGGEFTSDTGSEVTIITEPASRDLKSKLSPPSEHLVGAGSTRLNVLGECEIELMS